MRIADQYFRQFEYIIDGGPGHLVASTIVDCTGGEAEIVRQGIGQIDL